MAAHRGRRGRALVRLTRQPLRLEEAVRWVASPALGGLAAFIGTVRDIEDGRPIRAILYEAYEAMAQRLMERIVLGAQRRRRVRVAVFHRLGRIPAGEAAVIVAAAGVHRPEAFEACRQVIDAVKADVPIWKAGYERAGR